MLWTAANRWCLRFFNGSHTNKIDPKKGVTLQVVFVSETPRVREAKLAYGLRHAGWRVTLLYRNEPNFDVARYFDDVKRYGDPWEALSLAAHRQARVYHVFSLAADETSVAFIRYKPGKVVFDTNDIFEGMIRDPQAAHLVPKQRYCIERADGICCRDLQIRHASRLLGYRRGRRLFFPEYCWDSANGAGAPARRERNGLHAVLCGNFGIEKLGDTDWGYLDIAEKLAGQEIHFHIYPHWFWHSVSGSQFEETFADYSALARRSPFVHLHRPVSMDSVIPELSQYDVGMNLVRALTYGVRPKKYTAAHYRSCGSARIFDYIDAGLPVVTNRGLTFQHSLLARHGLAIDATPEMLDQAGERLKRFLSGSVKQKLREARSQYSVRRNIGRLIEFYQSM